MIKVVYNMNKAIISMLSGLNSKFLGILLKMTGIAFLAEFAILFHLKSVWIVLFILFLVVISLIAFCASKSNFISHFLTPPNRYKP